MTVNENKITVNNKNNSCFAKEISLRILALQYQLRPRKFNTVFGLQIAYYKGIAKNKNL